MPDKPAVAPTIPILSEIGSALAPILFFEAATTFGVNNGIVSITLDAITHIYMGTEKMRTERRIVAHLRTSIAGFSSLKGAINSLDLAIKPTESGSVN